MTHDVFKNGYNIAKEIFQCQALPELSWNQEGFKMHVSLECCNTEDELAIWQTEEDTHKTVERITLHPELDVSDARKLVREC